MAGQPQGLPFAGQEGKFFALEKFGGINTKAKRPAIGDQEFSWLENVIPIGDGNLRTLPSNGSILYTASAGTTIIYKFFYNIGTTTYVAVFQSDGTAYQVNTQTGNSTAISAGPGTFYNGTALPACSQWGASGIVIVSKVTGNDYWAWDGSTLYPAGSASPSWLNGGSATTMPSGVQGTCIETFQARVWIGNGGTVSFSGPSNGANFSGAVGGGSFASSDSFLRSSFQAIRQANGFLYLFGDSSINVISNVQTSGTPLSTTFNNQNIDPQVGTPWPNTVQAFGRGLVFANQSGVYALYGGSAEKVSDPLDGLFASSMAMLNNLSAALMQIYAIRVYMLLIPAVDMFTGQFRNVVAIWDGKKWFYGSQDRTLNFIAAQEINSELSAWGTDSTNVFPLFTTTSLTLNKIIQSKFWAGDAWTIIKQTMRSYMQAVDNSGAGYSITGTIDYYNDTSSPTPGASTQSVTYNSSSFAIVWIGAGNVVLQFTGAGGAALNFTSAAETITGANNNGSAALVGTTLQSTSPDFTIVGFAILYRNQAPLGG